MRAGIETLVADEAAADPFERAALEDQRLRIREALTRLSPRERLVLEERFGFDGEQQTIEAIDHLNAALSAADRARRAAESELPIRPLAKVAG